MKRFYFYVKRDNYRDCTNDRERIEWLYNRVMQLEEMLYGKALLQKLIAGLLTRPTGWEPLPEEEDEENE